MLGRYVTPQIFQIGEDLPGNRFFHAGPQYHRNGINVTNRPMGAA
jgi:hypothetical protein